jgi:hypothetical protein
MHAQPARARLVSGGVGDTHALPSLPGSPELKGAPARSRWRFRIASRGALRRLGVLALLIVAGLGWLWWACLTMPGRSHTGALPAATDAQRALAVELRAHVDALAKRAGMRSTFQPKGMAEAARHITAHMRQLGYGEPREVFVERGARTPNLEWTLPGTTRPDEIIVIGAHYDTYQGTPGADDNASGCAATLALAGRMAGQARARTVRFVFFVNEEPPAFWTADMGSWVYAKRCRANKDDIRAMLSLETMGYYSDAPGSQKYPPVVGGLLKRLYPDTGNFITFASNIGSRALVKRAIGTFRGAAQFPSEGVALPAWAPGIGWSDHWSFWMEGYEAIMVTDTAPFRNPNYHLMSDKPETLDYDRFSRVVDGLHAVVVDLADK